MALKFILYLTCVFIWFQKDVVSQTLSSIASACPNVDFTGCLALQNYYQICGSISSTDVSRIIACYCVQGVFDSFTKYDLSLLHVQ